MYKHLLVALDDTPLGVTTVNRSLEFARALGARITFFYAAPDLTATGEGALLFSLDRQAFSDESDMPRHAAAAQSEQRRQNRWRGSPTAHREAETAKAHRG